MFLGDVFFPVCVRYDFFLCIILSIFFYVYFYYFVMDFCLWNVFFMDYNLL